MKVNPPFVRTPFNYDRDAASDASGLSCLDVSLAQQQFKDDSDINTIVRRFNLSGELPSGVSVPQYGDFLAVYDYHSAMNVVRSADAAFMAMPAHVRARFDNDPGLFVDFISDEKNRAEAEALGLLITGTKPGQSGNPIDQVASPATPDAAVDNPPQ